jgi:hypothetical protein
MLEAEKAAAILATKTAALEAATAAKTALDEDVLRLHAYDKTQFALYSDFEDSDDAGINSHVLKATLFLQSAKPSEVRQWLPLREKVLDSGFTAAVLAFDAAAVLSKQSRARAQTLLKMACEELEVPVDAVEANEEEGIEAKEATVETRPAPLVGSPLPTLLLAAVAVAAMDMQKARRVLSPLEDEDGEEDDEPVTPEPDDTPWLFVTPQVVKEEGAEEEPEPGPMCRVLYVPTETPAQVLEKVAGAKKGPIPTEGMMLLGAEDAPLVEEVLEEGAEPKTLEGFGVEAGATLLLAPEPEPEPEPEAEAPEGGAE